MGAVPIYIPTNRVGGFLFLYTLSNMYSLEGMMLKLKLQYFGHLM